jgi:hypothetical protein
MDLVRGGLDLAVFFFVVDTLFSLLSFFFISSSPAILPQNPFPYMVLAVVYRRGLGICMHMRIFFVSIYERAWNLWELFDRVGVLE